MFYLREFLDLLKDYRYHTYQYLSFSLKCSIHKIDELTYFLICNGFLVEFKKKEYDY